MTDHKDHPAATREGVMPLPLSLPIPFPSDPIPNPFDPIPIPPIELPPFPLPHWPPLPHLCRINLTTGCWRITFNPPGRIIFHGTMRVETTGSQTTMSGDLYRYFQFIFPPFPLPLPLRELISPDLQGIGTGDAPLGIPIYARSRYFSYLKVTNIKKTPLLSHQPCKLTLSIDEFAYTHPAAPDAFNGTFPATPTRQITVELAPAPAPTGFTGSYFEGKLLEGGVDKGTFTMGWVSPSFRRAVLQVSRVANTVAPAPVPAASGVGMEDFSTVFATAGWDLSVINDAAETAIPAGTTTLVPGICPSDADLHALMTAVHTPAVHLDQEWRMHLLVVPGQMGCSRGRMFDQIGVHREGTASFCDDGYPSSNSPNFGAAANQQQRNVPRAYLRSASHEVGHAFNQIHQEDEGGADNSIMTTTPSVANVLGGPATGAPGVFPDNINLGFNGHVRHHLIHFPDPAVRPGAMNFATGHTTTVPEADLDLVDLSAYLHLHLQAKSHRLKLGQPLELAWAMENKSTEPLPAPQSLAPEAQYVHITVETPQGGPRPMPSFVIATAAGVGPLAPGKALEGKTMLFWSSNGFAFERPGRHCVTVRVRWAHQGIRYGTEACVDVWVDFPITDADNEVAAALLHPEVGKFVALGGNAQHLKEGARRVQAASKHEAHPACGCLKELAERKPHRH